MIIHNAEINDIDSILNIVKDTKKYFKDNGIPQWQSAYPDDDTFIHDINSKQLYVIKDDDEVIGFFAVVHYDPNYDYIENGKWFDNSDYVAIHRMAIKSNYKRKGVATYAFDELKKKYKHIRIDTHELNKPMNCLILKNNFKYCGIVYMEDKTKRNAYEYSKGQ